MEVRSLWRYCSFIDPSRILHSLFIIAFKRRMSPAAMVFAQLLRVTFKVWTRTHSML